jgi:hypothetical protein
VSKYYVIRKNIMKTIPFVINAAGILLLSSVSNYAQDNRPLESGRANWTVMVYMNANNNLEKYAFDNFNQMAQVADSGDINIVVQFARQAQYVSFPEWKGSLRFKISKGIEPTFENSLEKRNDPSLDESKIPDPNMGNAETLGDFVTWTRSKYPAKHYLLIIWDHGDGWRFFDTVKITSSKEVLQAVAKDRKFNIRKGIDLAEQFTNLLALPKSQAIKENPAIPKNQALQSTAFRAISVDDAHGGAKLYNREIEDTLRRVLNGDKLDILGFDACLMAMVETAYAMRNVADVMVGSEELEPGPGWHYEKWLTPLIQNPSLSSQELGKILVQSYKTIYDPSGTSTTMSAVNLASIPNFTNSIDRFSDALLASLRSNQELQLIKQVRCWCFVFAPGYGAQGIDFGQFSELVASTTRNPTLQKTAKQARLDLESTVIDRYMSADRQCSYGLAIYFPGSRALLSIDPDKGGYDRVNTVHPVEFVHDHRWADFIKEYCSKVP